MTTVNRVFVRPVVALIVGMLGLAYQAQMLIAQETKKVDVNIDINTPKGGTMWYGNWWVWAIGVAVFLIVIVALTNRGGRSDAA